MDLTDAKMMRSLHSPKHLIVVPPWWQSSYWGPVAGLTALKAIVSYVSIKPPMIWAIIRASTLLVFNAQGSCNTRCRSCPSRCFSLRTSSSCLDSGSRCPSKVAVMIRLDAATATCTTNKQGPKVQILEAMQQNPWRECPHC